MSKHRDKTKKLEADVVTARSFVLVDEKGKSRGEFSTYGDAVVLHLTTKQGEPMLTLQLDDNDFPSIALFSKGGKIAISFASGKNSTGLGISDPNGSSGIEIGMAHDPAAKPFGDRPCIVLSHEQGTNIISSE